MNRAVIYLRVSTEEQAEKGFSLQAQRQECTQRAQELNCDDILEYCDEGVSGSIIERPMLLGALEAMKQQHVDYFICYDPSRLSRNVSHQLILLDNIKKLKAKLIFIRGSFDDTAEGRFQLTIMAAVDEYERSRIKIRTELGKRAKAKSRQLTHNPNLYGYIFDKEKDCLYINETQAKTVKNIYGWLIEENLGPSKIADRLNTLGIPSMRGKQWSRVAVNRILSNYSYTGDMYIRRYDTKDYKLNKFKKDEDKIKISERPKEQWISVSIPEIIDKMTWDKAKLIMEKSKRIFKKKENSEYMLSGLLRCGVCGRSLSGKKISNTRYYCCSGKYNYKVIASERCNSLLYKAKDLESSIWSFIKYLVFNKNEVVNILDSYFYYNEVKPNRNGFYGFNDYCKEKIRSMMREKGKDITIEVIQGQIMNFTALQVNKLMNMLIKDITIINNSITLRAVLPQHIIEKSKDFSMDTILVGDVPESYIQVPEDEYMNMVPTHDPFDNE